MTRTFGLMHNQRMHLQYSQPSIRSNSVQRILVKGVHPIALSGVLACPFIERLQNIHALLALVTRARTIT